mmetsp:Transcript_4246/g.11517  ORF Transcript_4246/g.11517 Transcript_4246/m.11517 type:complete len:213 (-) Transcript_4246:3641-4279(-)
MASVALVKFTKAKVLPGNTRMDSSGPNWLNSSSMALLLGLSGMLPSHRCLEGRPSGSSKPAPSSPSMPPSSCTSMSCSGVSIDRPGSLAAAPPPSDSSSISPGARPALPLTMTSLSLTEVVVCARGVARASGPSDVGMPVACASSFWMSCWFSPARLAPPPPAEPLSCWLLLLPAAAAAWFVKALDFSFGACCCWCWCCCCRSCARACSCCR